MFEFTGLGNCCRNRSLTVAAQLLTQGLDFVVRNMAARPIAHLTRRYYFSASHRLHNGALDDAENRRVYGKCNNLYGHGHNYALEVTVGGPVDALTGMVVNLVDLDRVVEQEVLARFDHANLNCDSAFSGGVPTSEMLCELIIRVLGGRWGREAQLAGTRLERVRLEETSANAFEIVQGPTSSV
jgi:6-pyruvoyltetrahydropterin/6-carboxytetrahydropterin synthase